MNKKSLKILNPILMLCLFAWQSCNKERNIADFNRLQRIDAICDSLPAAAADSLATLHPKDFSRHNRAYYGLLTTIADDKTYTVFTSDSLINSVENYFRRHEKESDNHLRALIYQGIVRIRMGIADSTAYIPLKDAEALYLNRKNAIPSIGYMLYYHLGDVQFNNENHFKAHDSFGKTLQLAKQENDSTHIFDAYLALAWNEMAMDEKDNIYLDSTELYVDDSPDKRYTLLNAKSYAAKMRDDYGKALEMEKQQIMLRSHLSTEISLSSAFYSISTCFFHLNQLDSALFYAEEAIKQVKDSTYRLNYILYENAAGIAEGQQNFNLANRYRKKALEMYEESVDKQLDTQIVELEKKYNLSEAENKILKTEAHNRFLFAVLLVLVMVIGVAAFMINRRRKIVRLEQKNKESELQLAQQQAFEKERMTRIIIPYLSLYTTYQNELKALTYKKIGVKEGEDSKEYDKIVKIKKENFNKITQHLFTDELLSNVLKTRNGLDKFKLTDRMLLFMLAVGADNSHIVALLNTTPDNLKAKKSYLKKKIQKHASCFDDSDYLLSLFPSFSNP